MHTGGCCGDKMRANWVLWILLASVGIYAVMEHRNHLFRALPYLIFLACPLMHLFHGHAHQGNHQDVQHGTPPLPTQKK